MKNVFIDIFNGFKFFVPLLILIGSFLLIYNLFGTYTLLVGFTILSVLVVFFGSAIYKEI